MCVGGVESVSVGTIVLGLLPEGDTVIEGDLFYRVRLSGCAGLVASDVVTVEEDAITRDDLARFEKGDITNE